MELMNMKGSFDFLPEEQKVRNNIIDILKRNFEKYGYLPVETPLICYYDLLSYKYNEDAEILKEIYTLTDQGNRKLGLRYDLTVPFCKIIGMQKELKLPFRRYEIGKVFRNGPVKLGRSREFCQCDVDVVGIDSRLIEAEQILMAINTYKELNIEIEAVWNNRKIMGGLIKESGIDEKSISDVILCLDKMDKIGINGVSLELSQKGIDNNIIEKLFSLFDNDLNKMCTRYSNSSNILLKEGLNEAIEVNNYLEYLGIKANTRFSPFLARGLQIYTGIVFEFYDKKNRLTCALGGGGRYDKIITNFIDDGNTYPAIGLSFGLEPIYTILSKEKINTQMIDFYIIPMGCEQESLLIATTLRNLNYNVLIEMNNRKIKRCFEIADKDNIPYVIVIGDNEINTGILKVKNLIKREEFNIDINNISNIKDYIM